MSYAVPVPGFDISPAEAAERVVASYRARMRPICKEMERARGVYRKGAAAIRAWAGIDLVDEGVLDEWDPSVALLPLGAGSAALATSGEEFNRPPLSPEAREEINVILGMVETWRRSRSVFKFDPSLQSALSDPGSLDGIRLPYWCAYIDLRSSGVRVGADAIFGAFVYRSAALMAHENGVTMLHTWEYILCCEDGVHHQHRMYDVPGSPSGPCAGVIRSAVAYLASEDADVRPKADARGKRRQRRRPGKPAYGTTVYEVGYRIGQSVRRAESAALGGGVRAHVRRGHWHTYRVGKGRRERRIKWLAPMVVGGATENLATAVRNVEPSA